jgi:flagellar biogenesis protein FliO
VVVTLAWFLMKMLKGLYHRHSDGNRLKLMLTLPVGTRERIVVISYRDSEYLVGITAGGMSLLDKLPISEEVSTTEHSPQTKALSNTERPTSVVFPTN